MKCDTIHKLASSTVIPTLNLCAEGSLRLPLLPANAKGNGGWGRKRPAGAGNGSALEIAGRKFFFERTGNGGSCDRRA